MRLLLDTNVVIHALRDHPRSVRARLNALGPDDVMVSAVTVAELAYGSRKYAEPEQRRAVYNAFLTPYQVLAFDRAAAELHGELRFELRHTPIGERDLMIAAIALANDLGVVTANTREYARVPGLRVEGWR